MSVDIKSINKVRLLKAMWDNTKPASFFYTSGFTPPPFDEDAAEVAVTKYIDYFCGRCIKTDISGDTADPWNYDRVAGAGKFSQLVESLKK